jgi:pimeloyl-ACP methyl ester carboxylesterase
MPRVFIYIPGILQRPDGPDDWADAAVAWTQNHARALADRYEYCSPALFRSWGQAKRCKELRRLVEMYRGCRINLVGHSNGCELACRMLRECGDISVDGLHLIAGACDASFEANGLNAALIDGRVGTVHTYGSPNDEVLNKWARWSRWAAKWIGLGYGELGLVGPKEVSPLAMALTHARWQVGYGHSTWFEPDKIEGTLRLVTRNR